MRGLICDSGPLIASYNPGDTDYERSIRFLAQWPGRVLLPEPVLGETCNYLRNHRRNGPQLEARLLEAVTSPDGDYDVIDPTDDDRIRAADLVQLLVDAPLGYVDATIIAMAERLKVPDVATIDFKFLGMASQVCKLELRWYLQEN